MDMHITQAFVLELLTLKEPIGRMMPSDQQDGLN
jgi:hypothetical protein